MATLLNRRGCEIKSLALIIYRYYLLYFVGGVLIVLVVSGVRQLADAIMPESDGRAFSVINSLGWELVLLIVGVFSLGIGTWKLYKDFVVAPNQIKYAVSHSPLSSLEEHGFVFDGDYFKKAENGYLVLMTYHWIDYFKPKGNYLVGVLFNHQHHDAKLRLEKSEALELKYKEHIPPLLFCENFAYQLFPQSVTKPVSLKQLLEFKHTLMGIVAWENLPAFSQDQLDEALRENIKTVFPELEGLL